MQIYPSDSPYKLRTAVQPAGEPQTAFWIIKDLVEPNVLLGVRLLHEALATGK
jgi:hypothetical protein